MSQFHITEHTSQYSVHLADMHRLLRTSIIALGISCLFWSFFVSHIMSAWLDLLPLHTGPENENLSIYGPFDWIEARWSLVLVLAFTSAMPLTSILIQRFSHSGLLPSERSWLFSVLLISSILVPLLIIAVWAFVIPKLIGFVKIASSLDGVGISYDAASVFSLALGASWILIVWSLTVVSIGLARLYGLIEFAETRLRYRILIISGGTLVITLPVEFDGLRLLIAICITSSADAISRTIPVAPLGRRRFDITDMQDTEGTPIRIALLDCGCEDSCPRFPQYFESPGVAIPRCDALCLNKPEQDGILDLALHSGITRLVVSGCDGTPMPLVLRTSLRTRGCEVRGLNWLDENSSRDESWRVNSLNDALL